MNLEQLVKETLVQKHRRLMRAKCRHIEVYSSTVLGPDGTATSAFCLDCGDRIEGSHLMLQEVLNPSWDEGGRVHNWRNHVGDRARGLWHTFTDEQKIALALDADELASHEEWE